MSCQPRTAADAGLPVGTTTATFVGMPAFPHEAKYALDDAQLRANLRHATGTIRAKRAEVVGDPLAATVELGALGVPAAEDRLDRHVHLTAGRLREGVARLVEHDLLELGDDRLEVVGGQVDVAPTGRAVVHPRPHADRPSGVDDDDLATGPRPLADGLTGD